MCNFLGIIKNKAKHVHTKFFKLPIHFLWLLSNEGQRDKANNVTKHLIYMIGILGPRSLSIVDIVLM